MTDLYRRRRVRRLTPLGDAVVTLLGAVLLFGLAALVWIATP